MTTTIRDIIADAMERTGLNTDGGRSIGPRDMDQALRVAQQMILNLPGMRWWNDVETAADYTAGENERIRVTTASSVSITVPTAVASSRSLLWCCNQVELVCTGYDDRAPKDGARVHVSDVFSSDNTTYFYRADIAQWTQANALTLDSDSPLSAEFNEGLSAMLAVRLSAFKNVPLDDVTLQTAARAESRMRGLFGKRQDVAVDLPLVRTSSNLVWSGR
jgi:hypothetical protein